MSAIGDLLAWLQDGLQSLGEAVSMRVREEPALTVGLFRAGVTMLVGFGLAARAEDAGCAGQRLATEDERHRMVGRELATRGRG